MNRYTDNTHTIMLNLLPLKFFSQILLVAMLTVMVHCVHESTHTLQSHITTIAEQAVHANSAPTHQLPSSPCEHDKDFSGCDTCINCAYHAPLAMHPLQFGYNPVLSDLHISDIFSIFPQVYLSKFIPPQNLA